MKTYIKKNWQRLLKGTLMWSLSLVVIIPFLIVLLNSFKSSTDAMGMGLSLPTTWHFENYKKVWEIGSIPTSYWNSFLLSTVSVTLCVISASLSAFVIARNNSKYSKAVYIYFALGLMFPVNMVTVVKVLRWLHLYNTLSGTIVLFTALILPLSVFLYYGFIKGIPVELDEAAIMDGASVTTIFFKVLLPIMKPVTVTVVMINFLNVWNDFTVPLYVLKDPAKAVVVQQVYNFYGTFTASWNLVSVTILFATLPIFLIYLAGQRYIISGMVAGAVKG